ncbi:MAG: hypothetical protein US50_C0008G0012 [Candidatus Nomurabacteria bacterium GW2011_GWB1_37_5]|uniref:Uncharacterized protein n=1 Tax=Candidatus Nomurabacteria bacterium GW2011_GWB1_37_5 TaxID=1618742 RepID=A0A0G0K4W9_9BACT|nr:MAG: hypothetical protein US50_C0008G0012 [Candidatus Nomurabacteria bacterium GW2011_GWB1_37_5]
MDYRIGAILLTLAIDIVLGAAFIFLIKKRRMWSEKRDDDDHVIDLCIAEERENKEIIDVLFFFPAIHFLLLGMLYAFSPIFNVPFFETVYHLGQKTWSVWPSWQFWVMASATYTIAVTAKSIAYPRTNPKPIFWAVFGILGLFFACGIIKAVVDQNKNVEYVESSFTQPEGFPIDTVTADAAIVEWELSKDYCWNAKCFNCETGSLTDSLAYFETKENSRIIIKAEHLKCNGAKHQTAQK